jgi:hypothetical protein
MPTLGEVEIRLFSLENPTTRCVLCAVALGLSQVKLAAHDLSFEFFAGCRVRRGTCVEQCEFVCRAVALVFVV